MVTRHTPNASGTRTTILEVRSKGRNIKLGEIRRTSKGRVFVPSVRRLTLEQMDSIAINMNDNVKWITC
jgi:hypothetical protein